jgi:hypothetical protein
MSKWKGNRLSQGNTVIVVADEGQSCSAGRRSYVIRLIGARILTRFDGGYLKLYDPTYIAPKGYNGGIFEVTFNHSEAMRFSDLDAAIKKYRQSYGLRADGRLNRPLTAWTVAFVPVEELGRSLRTAASDAEG